ncbi:5'-nucleotidase C-terminal domain-containing protein [Balneolaceae bacterium ANBcel3]|nr:5'-nucleotidase C-terminal domain-containing protein [Balneolaceae bacterium ANBcel3]
MKRKTPLLLFLVLLLFQGCRSTESVSDTDYTTHIYYSIDDSVENDPSMAAYVLPYVKEMGKTMNRPLVVSRGAFERGKPEGALGNLTADIVRFRAMAELRKKVDVGILNNGGLRIPLPEGEINVGHIYELMPFENHIAVLEFTGDQLLSIADELAAVNGEAVSGIRFRIVDGRARDVLVDSMTVDPERTYLVATNNWMADGGGASSTLWEPVQRIDLNVLIRDAFIEYLNHREFIEPYIDQRIR